MRAHCSSLSFSLALARWLALLSRPPSLSAHARGRAGTWQDYAGSLLMAIGLGKAIDLEGIRKDARDKAMEEKALEFRREVVLRDDRIELSKHIAEFLKPKPDMDRVNRGLARMEKLTSTTVEFPNSLHHDKPPKEVENICWLENVEMIADQCLTKIFEFSKTRGTASGQAFSGGLAKTASNLLNQITSDVESDGEPGMATESNEMKARKRTVADKITAVEKNYTGVRSKPGDVEEFVFTDEYEKVWDDSHLAAQVGKSVGAPS